MSVSQTHECANADKGSCVILVFLAAALTVVRHCNAAWRLAGSAWCCAAELLCLRVNVK